MWEEILKLAVGNGLWAVLFCGLLAYLLRDGRMREQKYQITISALCDRLGELEHIKDNVSETLKIVRGNKKRVSNAKANFVDSISTVAEAKVGEQKL